MKTLALLMALATSAQAGQKYHLKITNGGVMPVSPPVVYTSLSPEASARIGSTPTAGFIAICQSGNATGRLAELRMDKTVRSAVQITGGPILPGQSRDLIVEVSGNDVQGIHIESMYGKTKDICAVASFNRHNLTALNQKVVSEVLGKDSVVATGAFLDPMAGGHYNDLCNGKDTAVACLRELSMPNTGVKQIRFATPYLPSVLNLLEEKYGATEVQSLLIPDSGALRLSIQLPH